MYCTKCGTSNPDRAQFCGRCGNKMGTVTPVTPVAAPPAPPLATPPPVTPVAAPVIPPASIPASSGKPPSQSDNSWIDPTPSQSSAKGNIAQLPPPAAQPMPMAQFPGVYSPSAPPMISPPIAQPPVAQIPVAPPIHQSAPPPSDNWVQFSQPAQQMPPQAAPPQPPPQSPVYAQPVYAQPAYGQPYPQQGVPAGYPSQELRGVGGWLMFLVLCLTIFVPIAMLFSMLVLLFSLGQVANPSAHIINLVRLFIGAIIPYTIWGIIVGTKLWKIRPGAANHAKRFQLFGTIPFSIILSFLPLVILPPTDQTDQAMVVAIAGAAVGGAIGLAWYVYLKSSRRMKNTFPQG